MGTFAIFIFIRMIRRLCISVSSTAGLCAASIAARAGRTSAKAFGYLDIHVIANFPTLRDRYFVASARGFFTSDKPEIGWVRAENGLTRDYFHDFVFLEPESASESPAMLIATADGSPGFWRRENRGARALPSLKAPMDGIVDANH